MFGIAPYTVILNNGPLRSEPDRKRLYRELRMLAGEWSGQMDAAAGEPWPSFSASDNRTRRPKRSWSAVFYAPGNLLGPDTPRDFAGIPQTGLRGDRMDEGSWRSACFTSRMSAMPEPWSRCWRQPCGSGRPREPGRRRSSKSCFRRRTR